MRDEMPNTDSPETEDGRTDNTKSGRVTQITYDVRSLPLTGLFILAFFYTLYFAKPIFLPLVLALLLSFLLAPVVRGLKRLLIPQAIGAALILLAILAAASYGVYSLSQPATEWMAKGSEGLNDIEQKLIELKKPVEKLTKETAERVEKLTKLNDDKKTQVVEVKRASLVNIVFNQTWEFVIGIALIIILLYFLLASGDLFLLKLLKVFTPLKDENRAIEIAHQIEGDISIYLLTITIINIILGAATGLAMFILQMPSPILWGVMAGFLNFVPFIGAAAGISIVGLVALTTFENSGHILLVPTVYFIIHILESNFITPLILGRRLALNPVVIFLGLIFWGWMWGIAGALIAVPMISIFKIICDDVKPLSAIGEFLGK
jgi:predicted PurR-regulated permease PerM